MIGRDRFYSVLKLINPNLRLLLLFVCFEVIIIPNLRLLLLFLLFYYLVFGFFLIIIIIIIVIIVVSLKEMDSIFDEALDISHESV